MNLVGRVAQFYTQAVVEGDGESLAFAQRGQQGNGQRCEEERGAGPAVRVDAEVERGDAEEDGDAVGDDHEHQRVAVVALIEKLAFGATLEALESAAEELTLAASRASAAQT